jgi:protein-disulfide isomerase
MNRFLACGAAALALTLAGCGGDKGNEVQAPDAPVTAVAPPAGKQWTEVVERTAEGGYRMGNPAAAVKLIEFGSRTCPHCAKFDEESGELRSKYVASGKVSYEFRDFAIHPQDPAAILLGQCAGPEAFFPLLDQMFDYLPQSTEKLQSLPADYGAQMQNMSPQDQMVWWAQSAGYLDFVRQRGIPEAKARACLSDAKGLNALQTGLSKAVADYNITGTPTFVINGSVVTDARDWESLKPLLRRAVGE